MSGGSFNYLYAKDAEDLLSGQGVEELNEMGETLSDLGYEEEAKETFLIQYEVKKARQELEKRINKIKGVWKAVEWYESKDSGIEHVQKEIEKFRKTQGE